MQSIINRNSMCILIPTYNRSEAIDYYLESKLDTFSNARFDVIVFDSSPNNLTQKIVEKHMKEGYNCLKYVKYKDPEGDIYGTKKSRDALVECADNYEYVWLCGDTAILLLEDYQDELLGLIKSGYDVIHIYANKKGISSECDMDYKRFFECFFWSMTHWCSFVLSSRFIKKMDEWMTEYLAMDYTTVLVYAIFAALPNNNFKIAYINHNVIRCSPCRIVNIAASSKDTIRGYAEANNIGIDNLPKEYDAVKDIAKKSFSKNTGMFSWQGAINLRADGNLTVNAMLRYKKHLRQMTDVPMLWFYLWSVTPKGIARKFSESYIFYTESSLKLQEINENQGKLILYGAGKHCSEILEKVQFMYKNIKVTAISDKNWDKLSKEYEVISPSDLCKYPYDYVGVAIVNSKIYKEVRRELIRRGISAKQIFHV